MIEPAFPNDAELVGLMESVADLRVSAVRLCADAGERSRVALSTLLRAMNSYYTNKIEGQHTLPADLEAAMGRRFSDDEDVHRRQELALAHMRLEADLEPVCRQLGWPEQFEMAWLCRIHRELYEQLPPQYRRVLDGEGNDRGALDPGGLREHDVRVGHHHAPPHEMLPDLLKHFAFRYGSDYNSTSRKVVAAGASMHRLSWIHPFADGNGRVSRLHNHLLLTSLGLTNGLWSPMRGLARRHADYYSALAAADATRRNATDGLVNLSSSGLTTWLRFWLDICLDQVRFMSAQLGFQTLEQRYISLALQVTHDFGRGAAHHRSQLDPIKLGHALYQLFRSGSMERGVFKAWLGVPDRSASRLISHLLSIRLLSSASRTAHLESNFPFYSLRFLFPGLWPEAEGIAPPEAPKAAMD
ncbi:Fic family protein [Bordetella genomosp. 8]|nr:Fic family protein [Bordetella genomosp. 8]